MKEITKQLKIINLISYRKAFKKWRVFTKDYLNIYNRSNSDLYCWARWMKVSQCLYNCTFSKGTFIKKKNVVLILMLVVLMSWFIVCLSDLSIFYLDISVFPEENQFKL